MAALDPVYGGTSAGYMYLWPSTGFPT